MTYSLNLFQPVLVGSGFLANLNGWHDWKRSIRSQGGFWQGSLYQVGDAADLIRAFNTWLGCHIQETAGAVTWEGQVYEMEITIGGARRRVSLDDISNAVACTYQADGEIVTSAWATAPQSIERYGRREELLLLDNYPEATALAYRNTFLAERAWPWPRPIALGAGGEARLDLVVCGYAFTANWLFLAEGDNTADDLDDWIGEVVGTTTGLTTNHGGSTAGAGDCQFLAGKSLATNTLQAVKGSDGPMRPWDLLSELAALGDSSGNPWRVWVDTGRLLHYGPISAAPRYFMRRGVLYDSAGARGASNPFQVRPAVVRDLDYPISGGAYGSFLQDRRDSFVEEVEVNAQGQISLKTAGYLSSDILAAQYQAYTPIDREVDQK